MTFFNQRSDRQRQRKPTLGTRVISDMVGSKYGGAPAVSAWSGQKYEQVSHYRFWIFIAINAIANKIASMTPNVGRILSGDTADQGAPASKYQAAARAYYRKRYLKAQTPLQDEEDIEPLTREHALVELLNHPNEYDSDFSVWYQTIMFLRLTGNAYWWTPPNGFDMPAEIHCIPAHWMIPRCYDPKAGQIVDYYDCRPIAGGGYASMHFPADEIVHFKYDSPLSKIDGHSQVAAGDRWFDISESIDQSRWNAMKQSMNPSGILELSPDFYDPDDAEINRIQMKLLNNVGERRAGKVAVLSPGMKFTPLMISARELDHVDGADQIRDMALAMFGVPKGAVGVGSGDMSRANLEGLLVGFFANTINPETKRLGETATKDLARKFDERAVIWWDDGSPSDAVQLNADMELDITAGTITKGEWRIARGRPLFGDERDDEVAGVAHQEPGMEGMPNEDDLFADDPDAPDEADAQPQHAADRMTSHDSAAGKELLTYRDTMFQTNGNGTH